MPTTVIVEGKRINYEEIQDTNVTIERIMQYLINGALTARLARMPDKTPSMTKTAKDIIVKTAFKR